MLRSTLAAALATLSLPLAAQTPTASPYDFIDAFRALSGEHKGVRKGHAKGVCAQGEFVASEAARTRLASPLFSGQGIPAQLRFSMAGGNPRVPDSTRSPRGLAARFELPDGSVHHLAMLSTPVFGAKDPDSFLGLLRAQRPGPDGKPDAQRIAAYREAHPDTRPQAEWLAGNPPPWSYATATYHGLHTFYVQGWQGERFKVRWYLQPQDGEKGLDAAEMASAPADFLAQRLEERLRQGAVGFDWIMVLGEPEDTDDDPSRQWPADRAVFKAGTLRISQAGGEACTPINFDPNVLSAGFSAGADPILRMRSPAYAISFGQRLSGQ